VNSFRKLQSCGSKIFSDNHRRQIIAPEKKRAPKTNERRRAHPSSVASRQKAHRKASSVVPLAAHLFFSSSLSLRVFSDFYNNKINWEDHQQKKKKKKKGAFGLHFQRPTNDAFSLSRVCYSPYYYRALVSQREREKKKKKAECPRHHGIRGRGGHFDDARVSFLREERYFKRWE